MKKKFGLFVLLFVLILSGCDISETLETRINEIYYLSFYEENIFEDNFNGIVKKYEDWKNLKFTDEHKKLSDRLSEKQFDFLSLVVINFKIEKSEYELMEITKTDQTLNFYINYDEDSSICDKTGYLLIGIAKEEAENIEKIDTHFNEYEYIKINFSEPIVSCVVYEEYAYVRKGNEYNLDYMKELFSTNGFIDMQTLNVYKDTITVNENISLLTYDDKVESKNIRNYVFQNSDFEYENAWYDQKELEDYEVDENNNIVIISNNITYIFSKADTFENSFYLSMIKGNGRLFNETKKEIIRRLNILYGSTIYTSNYISITLEDNGYVINLKELPLYG